MLEQNRSIDQSISRLHCWLESMRAEQGYTGPVAHWWQQNLTYTGPGYDWRYEGIVAGYLKLWERTRQAAWLQYAIRAANDLLAAQLPNQHYRASAFELNPASAGTPHESAADIALLLVAHTLYRIEQQEATSPDNLQSALNQPSWKLYATAAANHLIHCSIAQLWDTRRCSFRDGPTSNTFVPNKAATLCEALLLLADLPNEQLALQLPSDPIERYILPTLDRILSFQVKGGALDGAIAQNSINEKRVEAYFPIYIARSVPILLTIGKRTGIERYTAAAIRAMNFIARQINSEGLVATVIYQGGRAIWQPAWVAALGDILRAADLARPAGHYADWSAVLQRLLSGQDRSGGFQTATGFGQQVLRLRKQPLPDLRDLLHVVGWCDKTLRYLAGYANQPTAEISACPPFEAECSFHGRRLLLLETTQAIEVSQHHTIRYHWYKGTDWPVVAMPEFWVH